MAVPSFPRGILKLRTEVITKCNNGHHDQVQHEGDTLRHSLTKLFLAEWYVEQIHQYCDQQYPEKAYQMLTSLLEQTFQQVRSNPNDYWRIIHCGASWLLCLFLWKRGDVTHARYMYALTNYITSGETKSAVHAVMEDLSRKMMDLFPDIK
ncbi:MAG TPA: hypothetical protein VFO38_00385 [Candidatus Saccharimonadales bacterium]|nr:hypothetical protein [Candidatus Saccharimonadales bacterium]